MFLRECGYLDAPIPMKFGKQADMIIFESTAETPEYSVLPTRSLTPIGSLLPIWACPHHLLTQPERIPKTAPRTRSFGSSSSFPPEHNLYMEEFANINSQLADLRLDYQTIYDNLGEIGTNQMELRQDFEQFRETQYKHNHDFMSLLADLHRTVVLNPWQQQQPPQPQQPPQQPGSQPLQPPQYPPYPHYPPYPYPPYLPRGPFPGPQ
ncbi:hypothetical protein L2E82_45257 [Cichorium intybus]|uniref:Uncharacterized protein n=1 Tax=Cichorium intybus TaxID=13427 RepID=A0ACB8ZT09_CICIN|nr:hypothetical protein L2E82_45257 [Cichorium intybus]